MIVNIDQLTPEFIEQLEAMSIWRPASVQDEPETRLLQWRVYLVKGNIDGGDTIHFNGRTEWLEGRVCSPIQEYDPTTKRARTRSGRVYELVGHSGFNSNASYVWNKWMHINGNPEVIDITSEYE